MLASSPWRDLIETAVEIKRAVHTDNLRPERRCSQDFGCLDARPIDLFSGMLVVVNVSISCLLQ